MADKKQVEQKEKAEEKASTGGFTMFSWLILAAVVVVGSTGGFALSQLFGGQDPAVEAHEKSDPANDRINAMLTEENSQNTWIEEFEPVLANLDEPGVTRYVRVTVTLEMSEKLDEIKGREYLGNKKMLMRDWMTTYFAGLTLEDVRGTRNLGRIKREVVDQFNEMLFPDNPPFIKRVLFKEFAVQ